ncbi:MAG: DUF1330 domain-containing protein [Deltaproteobacteria bacterium]
MTQYVLIQLDPTDETMLAKYREHAGSAAAKHGGHQVGGGAGSETVEDNGLDARLSVLAKFPDANSARNWLADPDLAPVHAMRRQGAKTVIQILTVRD